MTDRLIDIHTHDLTASAPSIISVEPGAEFIPGKRYSVGIHPYTLGSGGAPDTERLWTDAARPEVVAIGETGIDRLKGGLIERQLDILRVHIDISEQLGKPLIMHVVKGFTEVVALRIEMKPRQRWIVHGFRGKPELARELLRHGFDLSLGERFNSRTAAMIPADRLWVETDTSPLSIAEIAARVASCRDGGWRFGQV